MHAPRLQYSCTYSIYEGLGGRLTESTSVQHEASFSYSLVPESLKEAHHIRISSLDYIDGIVHRAAP